MFLGIGEAALFPVPGSSIPLPGRKCSDAAPIRIATKGNGSSRNRISKVGSDSGVYRYDALGRRVVKTYEVGDGTNVPADYDWDGKSDAAVWRPDTAHWFIRPSLSPETTIDIEWGVLGSKAVPADYDGDGIADVAVWMPDTGLWSIRPSSSPETPIQYQWGVSTDVPVTGDYDGDGMADFAVWRPGTGAWYIVPSSDPGNYISAQWGLSTDVPISSGDFDGDGKTDIAVWRPETGIWYILPSSDPGNYISIVWGMQPDNPVSGDYDGDGVTDAAVKRSSTALWYVRPSLFPETMVTYSDPSLVTGSIISLYGPGNELLVEYKSETGPSGSNVWQTNHILNGSTTIAKEITPQSGAPTTEYLHRNHLSQAVDPINYSTGYGIDSTYGRPFGSGGDDQFAGHKDDPESGLHYNLARSYNPIMSRWPSPDSATTKIYDPQSLNKYAYNRNDPVNLVDPDGREPIYYLDVWDLIAVWQWYFGADIPNAYYYIYYYGNLINDTILAQHGLTAPTNYDANYGGGGGDPYNAIRSAAYDAANRFIDRLWHDDECAELFGFAGAQTLQWMVENYYIGIDANGDIPTKEGGSIAYTVAGQRIYINANGPFLYPIYTRVAGGGTVNFLAEYQRQYRMPNMDTAMFQELVIGHELGHIVGFLIPNDAGDPMAQHHNNQIIINACFKDDRSRSIPRRRER